MEILQDELTCYLAGEQSLSEFYHWFVPEAWDVHQWASPRVQEVVGEINLLLAEYSSGHRTEQELKDLFAKIIEANL